MIEKGSKENDDALRTHTLFLRALGKALSRALSRKPNAKRFEILVVGLLWIFYATNLVIWENNNRRLVAFDQVGHFFNSIAIAKIMESPWILLNLSKFFMVLAAQHAMYFTFTIYPPFAYLIAGLFYLVLPSSLPVASLSNVIFLLILMFSVYGLANDLAGSRAALVTAFLVGAYPILVGLSRLYYLDFPLTAMVSLTLLLLIKTDDFRNRKIVLLLSFTLIAGMLTKQTFPLYVSGPLAYVALKSLRNKAGVNNLILCAVIASLSIGYYVFLKPGGLGMYLSVYQVEPQLRGDVAQSYPWIISLKTMAEYGTGIPLFVLFSAGVFDVLRSSRHRVFILVGLVTPIVMLAIIEPFYPYDPRFIAPILPLVALASAVLFKDLNRHSRRQVTGAIIVVIFVLAQYGSITYNEPILAGILPFTESEVSTYGIYAPSAQDWRIPQILRDLRIDAVTQHLDRPSVVVLVQSSPYFDQTVFLYYAYVNDVNFQLYPNGAYSSSIGISSVCNVNYVVIRLNVNPAELQSRLAQNVAVVTKFVLSHLASFVFVGNYTLPDGTIASLLRRTSSLTCSSNAAAASVRDIPPFERTILA